MARLSSAGPSVDFCEASNSCAETLREHPWDLCPRDRGPLRGPNSCESVLAGDSRVAAAKLPLFPCNCRAGPDAECPSLPGPAPADDAARMQNRMTNQAAGAVMPPGPVQREKCAPWVLLLQPEVKRFLFETHLSGSKSTFCVNFEKTLQGSLMHH